MSSHFFPSAQDFACQIFPSLSCSSPLPSSSDLVFLSVPQDKLSQEVQKQQDGLKENGYPPVTQSEADGGLTADPDDNQAEEDKTKPLLERLKALEVITTHCATLSTCFLTFFHFFLLHHPSSSSSPGCPLWKAVRVLVHLCLKAWQLITICSLLHFQSKVILRE